MPVNHNSADSRLSTGTGEIFLPRLNRMSTQDQIDAGTVSWIRGSSKRQKKKWRRESRPPDLVI